MEGYVSRETIKEIKGKLNSKRSVDVYNASIDIRKNVIKTKSGIDRLVREQVIPVLLRILKRTSAEQATFTSSDDSYKSKIKDIICSILGNLCMEASPREEVIKHDGVKIIGDTFCTSDDEAIQNRCCRCIANMCCNPSAWKLVHDSESEIIEKIVKLLKDSENPECQQTYIRAIRLLGQTGPYVQTLLDKNAVSAVMKYLDSDSESVAKSAIICIGRLVMRRNTIQFAGQVVSSGKLPHLISIAMATTNILSHDAVLILLDLSEQHNFRPSFGNAGGITLFKCLFESPKFSLKEKVISVLCLCCKEAVNRVKLREEGILKLFIEILKDDLYMAVHLRIVSALVCFLYDETSFDVLLENGLVPVLIMHLRMSVDGDVLLKPMGKIDQCNLDDKGPSTDAPCFDKKDNKSAESVKTDSLEQRREPKKILSQLDHGNANEKEIEDKSNGNKQLPDPKKKHQFDELKLQDIGNNPGPSRSEKEKKTENINQENLSETAEKAIEDKPVSIEDTIGSEDPLSLSVAFFDENKASTSKGKPLYSIDSPTYEIQSDEHSDYSSGAKCKRSFSPQTNLDRPHETYSPISNISYYSPVKSTPEYSPKSDRSTSPTSSASPPLYSYCGLGSPYDEHVNSPASPEYVPDEVEVDMGWSWSPDNMKDSSSDSDNENDLIKTDDSRIKEKLPDDYESSGGIKKEILLDDKKADGTQLYSMVTEDEVETKTQKTKTKRKKSDNAMENNIFILLSRVSQMTNPTIHFVAMETISCLLDYINEMEAPLARSARLLSRVFRNPHCFQKLLVLKVPLLIYQKLLQNENIPEIIKKMHLFQKEEKRASLSSGFRSRSSSISSVSSDSDRFSLFEETTEDERPAAKRQRGSGSGETIKREVAGVLHKQCEEVCDPGKCGMSFLEDLASVADSPYGRGVVEKLVRQDQKTRNIVCLSALYLCRNQGTLDFCHRWDIFTNLFNMIEDRQPGRFKTIVQGFSLIAHLMNFKTRFQSSSKGDFSKASFVKRKGKAAKSDALREPDDNLREPDTKDSEPGTNKDISGEINEVLLENLQSYSCKECLCTFSIPCVLHSKHTCITKDVTFIVKGERLMGCRNTLTKSSELFAAMLEGHYSESSLSEIDISETSKFAFTYVLHYLHGCKQKQCAIGNYFSSREISVKLARRLVKVLKEADKYLLYDLKFELQDLLFDKYIVPEVAPNIFEYAVMYDCLKIQRAAVSCVLVDTSSQRELLLQFKKCMDSKFAGVFINTLMELLLG